MPRKTRKEKRKADKRRKVEVIPPSIADKGREAVEKNTKKEKSRRKKKAPVAQYTESDYDKKLREFTKKDVVRTIIITIALFLLQGAFFYFSPF